MKSESDAKTPGRRILRVVVVASDKDIGGLSVEDEDGNPAIQVRVHVETSERPNAEADRLVELPGQGREGQNIRPDRG